MSATTGIQWTDATWNAVTGCDQVSPGCAHCYAKVEHDRRHKASLAGRSVAPQYAHAFEIVQLHPDRLTAPLSRRAATKYFVASGADPFHENVPFDFVDKMLAVMALSAAFGRGHVFQLLTKRPARMLEYFTAPDTVDRWADRLGNAATHLLGDDGQAWAHVGNSVTGLLGEGRNCGWPLNNLWLGVSVENQHFADKRIPLLMQTPAAVRFLSCEPLLGPVDLRRVYRDVMDETHGIPCIGNGELHWVIVGGESGGSARAMARPWLEAIVADCTSHGVPLFVKQMGRWMSGDHTGFIVNRWLFEDGRVFIPPTIGDAAKRRPASAIAFGLCDTHGGQMIEWPTELQVREFPSGATIGVTEK